MRDLKSLLTPDDFDTVNATADISWLPKEPKEILLPYIPNSTDVEDSKLDQQRKKTKEVLDGYTNIINSCKQVEAQIEERCKQVKVPLSRKKSLRVVEAMARIFGQGEQETISFDQYKACIKALAKINNQIPKPEDKS